MTIKETVGWFNSIFEINNTNGKKSDFNCSVADDTDEYKKTHPVEFLGITRCDNWEVVDGLMDEMQQEGYDCLSYEKEDMQLPVFVCLYKKAIN